MKNILIFALGGLFLSNTLSYSQNFKIAKATDNQPLTDQSILYSLPRTGLSIQINYTITTIKRGIYAEYAQKYLRLENVPFADSTYFTITEFDIKPFNDPDPDECYALTFKTFPSNIESLFSKNNYGIMLDLSGKWAAPHQSNLISENTTRIVDPRLLDETINVHVDTFYKTILSDTSFIKVPVFKKQIIATSHEDLIKEAAHQLIKTRKNRIKFARGEYDYHPDAATLRVLFDEMQKQEDAYLSLFQGTKTVSKQTAVFTAFPSKDLSNINLCYFESKKGILNQPSKRSCAITLNFNKEDLKTPSLSNTKKGITSNLLYFRIPNPITVSLLIDETEKFKSRIPFYQFGTVQGMTLITK